MVRILDSTLVNNTNKVIESDGYYYINGVGYNKTDMTPIIFKSFCNGGASNVFSMNNTLAPVVESTYWTGLRKNAILRDSKNVDISYVANYFYSSRKGYTSGTDTSITLNIFKDKKKIYKQHWRENQTGYTWGENFVTWLGQSDTTLYYVSVQGSQEYSYAPDNSNYPIRATINAIPKKIEDVNDGFKKVLLTISKSNGNFKVIKETKGAIYFVLDKNGYEYEFAMLNKDSDKVTILKTFRPIETDYYDNTNSPNITCSDIIKKEENLYECYIGGQKTLVVDDSNTTYPEIISKLIIDTSSNTVEIKPIQLDETPFFGKEFGKYYNEVFTMEDNGKRFLITMTSCAYSRTFPSDTKLISVYELNEENPNSISGTLVDSINDKNIVGDFHGMIKNSKYNSFIAFTSITAYIFKFNSQKKIFERFTLSITPNCVGIDLNSNYWVMNNLNEVFYFNEDTVWEVDIKLPNDELVYEGQDINSNIKVATQSFLGGYIQTRLRLTILGDAKFTNEDKKIIVIDTNSNGYKDIPITITNSGSVEIVPEIIF